MQNIRKFVLAIRVLPVSSTTIDSMGEIEVLNASGKANYHNGTTASPFVTEAHAATLTNKTIDATLNTITNISDTNLAPGAAIARSKIASGTVNSVVIDDGSGNLSTATLTSGQILQGNGSAIPTPTTVTGDVLISSSGVTTLQAGVVSNANVNAAAAIVYSKLNLSNSIVNADINSAAAIAYSKLNLSNSIVDADIASGAAIARNKLAAGSANQVVVNDGSGNLSSVAVLPETQGGTNQSSYTKGDTLYASAANTLSKLSAGTTGQAYVMDSTGVPKWGAASGSGGVNFVGLNSSWQLQTSDDRDFEASVGNWVAYADAAGVIPVDMTGGSPVTTIGRTTTAGQVLDGSGSGLITKDAANRQGEGVSCVANVPLGYRTSPCQIRIPFKLISGSLVQGDLKVFIYDITNSVIITPSNNDVIGSQGTIVANFDPNSTSAQIRVGFFFASTSTSAVTLSFDDVQVGPQTVAIGFAGSNPQSYIPTIAGGGSLGTTNVYWVREGKFLRVYGTATLGAVTTTIASITLPTNYNIDSSFISSTSNASEVGTFSGQNSGGSASNIYVNQAGVLFYDGSDTTKVYLAINSASSAFTKANMNVLVNSSIPLTFEFKVPVSQFDANITLSQTSTYNISSIIANGTRVTATPANLGEYRTYQKSITAISGTDNAPTTAPTGTDGMLIYSVAYTSAGTSGQTNRWEIFVGKNKNIFPQFFANAAKTGDIDTKYDTSNGLLVVNGLNFAYDPSTGVAVLDAMNQATTTSTRTVGSVIPTAGGAVTNPSSCYFDIKVSENALAVGTQANRSYVVCDTGNGQAGSVSGDTKIRNFTNATTIGTAITRVVRTTTTADYFLINEDGIYSAIYMDAYTGGALQFGISLNSTQTSTSIGSIGPTECIAQNQSRAANQTGGISATFFCKAGDKVRAHTDGNADTSNNVVQFRITKIAN